MPHWPIPPWHTIKYDLQNITALLAALGDPHLNLPPVIHVAGTNGKGTTIAFMRAILEAAGLKVHVYTSPHLVEFNERIVPASEKIDDEYLFDVTERTRVAAESIGLAPTFFEGTTAAAFLAFSEVKADIVLLETGMGGRLDATNVIPRPLLTVITTIAYDHMEYLGPTLPIIAGEKAGIIKPGVPCVIGCQTDEVYDVLFAQCELMRAPITAFGADFGVEAFSQTSSQKISHARPNSHAGLDPASHESPETLGQARGDHKNRHDDDSYFKILGLGIDDVPLPKPSLLGDHQLINASTAIAAIRLISSSHPGLDPGSHVIPAQGRNDYIQVGLKSARWPARLQKINDKLWVDGAHNAHGAQVLSVFCTEELEKPISLILGLTKNRNPRDFLPYFEGIVDEVFCVQVRSEPSSYTAERLAALAAPAGLPLTPCDSLEEALERAAQKKGATVVTGSLFLAADLFKLLRMPV